MGFPLFVRFYIDTSAIIDILLRHRSRTTTYILALKTFWRHRPFTTMYRYYIYNNLKNKQHV